MTTGLMRTNRAGVAWLDLDRPDSRNALSTDLLLSLQEELTSIGQDPDTSVVVLSGKGRAFCAGGDIKEFGPTPSPEQSLRRFELIEAVLIRLRDLAQPKIAAVNGAAIGAGWGLAMMCDLCFSGEGATYSLPELRKDLRLPAVVVRRLTQITNPIRAAAVLLEGRVFDASQAADWGWATSVFEDGDALRDHSWQVARQLASTDPQALAAITESLRHLVPVQLSSVR